MGGAQRSSPTFDWVDTSKIQPNLSNPRGPNVRENDAHRENLRESIAQFGILVPLVVRSVDGRYELIDGERRYWVARSLKFKQVPAYIVSEALEGTAVLQRMFQIHVNRDPWDAVQQCKASEFHYKELLEKYGDDANAIINNFAAFTGDDRRTARNRVQFLRWPRKIKDEIYADPEKHDSYWYVVEIEDKIIEPAQRNFPEYFEKVSVDEVREFLYRKWETNIIQAAVDVRQAAPIVRSRIEDKKERKKALKLFNKLVRRTNFSYEDARNEFDEQFPNLVESRLPKPKSLINRLRKVTYILSQYELEYVRAYGGRTASARNQVIDAVKDLVRVARRFLERMKR